MDWKDNKIIIILTIGFIILNLIGLDRSPPVWFDEVTLNDPAKELAFHGKLRSSVFAGFNGFDEAYFWQPPGQYGYSLQANVDLWEIPRRKN